MKAINLPAKGRPTMPPTADRKSKMQPTGDRKSQKKVPVLSNVYTNILAMLKGSKAALV
jgi:hypothetical protein